MLELLRKRERVQENQGKIKITSKLLTTEFRFIEQIEVGGSKHEEHKETSNTNLKVNREKIKLLFLGYDYFSCVY